MYKVTYAHICVIGVVIYAAAGSVCDERKTAQTWHPAKHKTAQDSARQRKSARTQDSK